MNRDFFGRIFIGLVISAVFHGTTIIQIVTFMRNNEKSPLGQKLAVWFLWVLDMLHLIFMVHMEYYHLVSHSGDTVVIWSFGAFLLVQFILLSFTQSLYIRRIWKITRKRRYVSVVLGLLVLLNFVAGLIVTFFVLHTRLNVLMYHHIPAKKAVIFTLVMTSALDFLIVGSLCWALSEAGTNLRWTDSSATMLLAYFVNTGAIVSIFSVAVLIAFLISEYTSDFLALLAVTIKLYVVSFLGMVNARHYFQSNTYPLALVPHSETSSQYSSTDGVSQSVPKTINEVGLPLFQPSAKSEDVKIVEVMVKQEAHSGEI